MFPREKTLEAITQSEGKSRMSGEEAWSWGQGWGGLEKNVNQELIETRIGDALETTNVKQGSANAT